MMSSGVQRDDVGACRVFQVFRGGRVQARKGDRLPAASVVMEVKKRRARGASTMHSGRHRMT